MKKFFALMLSLAMALSLFAGCNSGGGEDGEFTLSSDVEFVCPFSAGGGSGSGTEDELCTGLIEVYCGVDLEYIPYDSSAEVLSAVLGGHISAGIFNPNEVMSQYNAGEVTLLGAFGPDRISVLPEVPTFTELGYEDVQFQQFRAIFGPGNMEQAAVDFWVDVFSQVVEHEDWTEGYLAPNGLTSSFMSGEEFTTFIEGEAAKYQNILDTIGLSANS